MNRHFLFLLSLLVAQISVRLSAATITSVRELSDAVVANSTTGVSFAVEGEIVYPKSVSNVLVIRDSSNAVPVCHQSLSPSIPPAKAGYRVRLVGKTRYNSYGNVCADFDALTVLSVGDPPPPALKQLSPADFQTGRYDYRPVTLKGTVYDVFADDIDPKYLYLLVKDGDTGIFATTPLGNGKREDFDSMINSEVEVEGICIPRSEGTRIHLGRIFKTHGREVFHVLRETEHNVFHAPPLEDFRNLQPAGVTNLGRRRVAGLVSAVWGGDHILLHTGSRNGPLIVELANPKPPVCGDTVEVVGFPFTDLYRINLRRAKWRNLKRPGPTSETPSVMRIRDIFADSRNRSRIDAMLFGRLLTVSGQVFGLPADGNKDRRMYVSSDGFILPVDIGSCTFIGARLSSGCRVAVTGICVMETENWQTDSVFPRIKDGFLVVRNDNDICITAYPPWWTPGRLLAIISSLIAVLVAVLLWNTSLRRLAERRGRALFKTEIDKASAELKTYERTRLAIELHDMLSQMLSGISMQIGTVRKFFDTNGEKALHHLDIAAKTLFACRESLRDCLWDLRNSALEEPDMDKAIRETLEPHVEDTTLAIRFNIPRDRLTDKTAHAILSIIRELTVNSIRHGKATSVRIAGCIESGNVLFSVTDNGCGFDPDTAPGMSQGHFGLQGIRERVESFEGYMTVASALGQGTKISIRLRLPKGETENPSHG